jgi:hypothetical protein
MNICKTFLNKYFKHYLQFKNMLDDYFEMLKKNNLENSVEESLTILIQ